MNALRLILATACLAWAIPAAGSAATPRVGETAPDFALRTLDGQLVALRGLTASGPVVLVVLRGWPEYQCPICTKQVQDYIAHAADFAARGAQVLMVYPGPAERLKEHAQEFVRDKQWPSAFRFVLDPDYAFTRAYGLRWEAKRETAYPATFVLERGGNIRFAYVSRSHGDRVGAARALTELP